MALTASAILLRLVAEEGVEMVSTFLGVATLPPLVCRCFKGVTPLPLLPWETGLGMVTPREDWRERCAGEGNEGLAPGTEEGGMGELCCSIALGGPC